jgi:hypothetical protein
MRPGFDGSVVGKASAAGGGEQIIDLMPSFRD